MLFRGITFSDEEGNTCYFFNDAFAPFGYIRTVDGSSRPNGSVDFNLSLFPFGNGVYHERFFADQIIRVRFFAFGI